MTSPARQALVDAALSVVGYTDPDPRYLALVDPGDTGAHELAVATESGCGLVCLGIEEAAGFATPRGPYLEGTAFNLIYDRAGGPNAAPWHPLGALRLCHLEAPPQPGDAIVYGASPLAPAHVDACVIDREPSDDGRGLVLSAVAGGQRTGAGLETVALVARQLDWTGACWRCRATGRDVLAVVDAVLLAERVSWCPPTPRNTGVPPPVDDSGGAA